MKPQHSLRNKLILSLLLGCLIPYIIGGFYLKGFIEEWHRSNHTRQSELLLREISELIDQSLLFPMGNTVKMLSVHDQIVEAAVAQANSPGALNTHINHDMTMDNYEATATEKELSTFFSNIKAHYENINFVFFATTDGAYMEYPQFKPSKGYDPRERPWYQNTIKNDGLTISDPYVSQVTNELIMSFTMPVKSGDKTIGVIGISAKVVDLMTKIGNIKLGESGYLLVLNNRNKIAISPAAPEWMLETPEQIAEPLLSKLVETGNEQIKGTLLGEKVIADQHISASTDWKIVSIVKEAELLAQVNEVLNILYVIYFITLSLISILVLTIIRSTTQPILALSQIVDRIAHLDFRASDRDTTQGISQNKDETGIIANSILTMVNQIQQYIADLKTFNQQITEQNELLSASEEELIAQVAEIDSQRRYIDYLAFHDPLTGLANRRKFNEMLELSLRSGRNGAVVLLDVDNFKRINDTLGHVYGDKVLQAIGLRLLAFENTQISVSRFGGDEFLILIETPDDGLRLEQTVLKLKQLFQEPLSIEENQLEIQLSMGIARFPQDSQITDQLIMYADMSLYTVKSTTKGEFKYFDNAMAELLATKGFIEQLLKSAIQDDGFELVYQPQVSVSDLSCCCYEALLRLKSEPISPAVFIPIAEETGLIIQIGRIVTRKAVAQLAQWQNEGYANQTLSINFSAAQVHDSGYIDFLEGLLKHFKVSAENIEIEITENIFIENREMTLQFMGQIKTLGIKISIDDFGTGYSSLSYLTYLPIDKVKLDKSLSDKFLSLDDTSVMDNLISLAQSLGLEVVAEGIETAEQYAKLRDAGCNSIQGYYFSKPLKPQEAICFKAQIT